MELMKSLDFVNATKSKKKANEKDAVNHISKIPGGVSGESISQIKKAWGKKPEDEKKEKLAAFHTLLMQGPVMDDDQYEQYKKIRNRFNTWRQN